MFTDHRFTESGVPCVVSVPGKKSTEKITRANWDRISEEISLFLDEIVIGIKIVKKVLVTSLLFVTNLRILGPFGKKIWEKHLKTLKRAREQTLQKIQAGIPIGEQNVGNFIENQNGLAEGDIDHEFEVEEDDPPEEEGSELQEEFGVNLIEMSAGMVRVREKFCLKNIVPRWSSVPYVAPESSTKEL